MKTLYLDCQMGAAGDMLAAALFALLPHPEEALQALKPLEALGIQIKCEPMTKCGIRGLHWHVTVDGAEEESLDAHDHAHTHAHEHEQAHMHTHTHEHEHVHEHQHQHAHTHKHEHTHSHQSLAEIESIIRRLDLPEKVTEDAVRIYRLLADAESAAHGVPVAEIHFHEVGTMDAVADIVGVCYLMHLLSPDEVIASPVHVGSGSVHCAHGILPVPAPATAHLLTGIPIYSKDIEGELCTPTGAALLKYFVHRFAQMPLMRVQKTGYGMGKKDFARANLVRAFLGEGQDATDSVTELSCNVDDMTAEAIAFATERLLAAGAKDVYTVPIGMKKNRPGTLIRVVCDDAQKEEMAALLFRHTSTAGIRENTMQRYILDRTIETVETPYGQVRKKTVKGYGTERFKYEYEDLARIAIEQNCSLEQVKFWLK